MARHFLAFAMTAGLIWGQAPLSPAIAPVAPSAPGDAPPAKAPTIKKGSGLERQRTSVKRQLGDVVEVGWLFRPWPKPETRGGGGAGGGSGSGSGVSMAPVAETPVTTSNPPAPVSQ